MSKKHQAKDITIPSDYVMFMPSCSSFYAKTVSGKNKTRRMPEGLENGIDALNYFNKDKGLFYYKYNLYSAGHAELDVEKSKEVEDIVWNRDPGTIVLGDSGGYQIASGILNFDWSNPHSDANNKMRERILRWQEALCDLAMTLDIPTRAIENDKATSIKGFDDCLDWTLINLDWIMKNQNVESNTRILNVIQGLTWQGGKTKGGHEGGVKYWYEKVKKYNDVNLYGDRAFRGWAFGGSTARNFATILKLLVLMRDDGFLTGRNNWIHVLGQTRLGAMVALTEIQRAVRKTVKDSEFVISADSASAFLSVAKGQGYFTDGLYSRNDYKLNLENADDYVLENREKVVDRFNYDMRWITDDKTLINNHEPWFCIDRDTGEKFVFDNTEIGRRLKNSDICVDDTPFREFEANSDKIRYDEIKAKPIEKLTDKDKTFIEQFDNKWSKYEQTIADLTDMGFPVDEVAEQKKFFQFEKKKEGKRTSWDTFSYALIMNHNVEVMVQSVMKAHELYDSNSDLLPGGLRNFKGFPEEVLSLPKKEAFKLIDKNRSWLGTMAGQVADRTLTESEDDELVNFK